MNERKVLISQPCPQYDTQVEFLMETSVEAGRTLVARYATGGPGDLPIVAGKREFRAGIPDAWSEDFLLSFLALNRWPSWELPARAAGSSNLFSFGLRLDRELP
jgi:hypothetical protein